MIKKKQKQKKKTKLELKQQTKVIIDKNLAKAFSLTLGKMKTYRIDSVYFNTKEKELVATDGSNLIIIKIKSTGTLSEGLNLEEGFYDIVGNILIKNDEKVNIKFPNYRNVIPKKPKEICSGDILYGLLDCMIINQIHLDIWKSETVLRVLNRLSSFWDFFNNSLTEPILIKTDNAKYNIKYIMMPWPTFFTNIK